MEKIELNNTQDEKIKTLCSNCKQSTNHIVLLSADVDGSDDFDGADWFAWDAHYQIIQCQGCDTLSFRKTDSNSEDMIQTGKDEFEVNVNEKLYPQRGLNTLPIKELINTPTNLRRIYREVIDCYNNESFTLCGAGLRAIIDGLCAENGVTGGEVEVSKKDGSTVMRRKKDLEGKISGLHEKGLLTKKHSDLLHEHRFMGNEAVHELAILPLGELKLAISIAEHTLETIYELPERAEELRLRKARRKRFTRIKRII